ncbi:MAG: hypothetical protein RL274_2086 [Pseudomonadota bacterium]|jgi:hypothetical protein
MVALDNHAIFGSVPRLRVNLAPQVAGIALVSVAVVLGAIVFRGFAENGFRLGSQLAWRYTFFVFFAAMVVEPACRLTARLVPDFAWPESLSRKLFWGFCASYGVYLLSVFLPNVIHLSGGATLMVVFGASVALVMALAVAPLQRHNSAPLIGERTRRTALGIAMIYFWSCYSLMALARISGPHRPDAFYDISISLMLVALLLRFADRWFSDRDNPETGYMEAAPV